MMLLISSTNVKPFDDDYFYNCMRETICPHDNQSIDNLPPDQIKKITTCRITRYMECLKKDIQNDNEKNKI